jgi:hypothetical protein
VRGLASAFDHRKPASGAGTSKLDPEKRRQGADCKVIRIGKIFRALSRKRRRFLRLESVESFGRVSRGFAFDLRLSTCRPALRVSNMSGSDLGLAFRTSPWPISILGENWPCS